MFSVSGLTLFGWKQPVQILHVLSSDLNVSVIKCTELSPEQSVGLKKVDVNSTSSEECKS